MSAYELNLYWTQISKEVRRMRRRHIVKSRCCRKSLTFIDLMTQVIQSPVKKENKSVSAKLL